MEKTNGEKRRRLKIKRELPPQGTVLIHNYLGVTYEAKIVKSTVSPGKRVVYLNGKQYSSLSTAASAITGNETNGWVFWHIKS